MVFNGVTNQFYTTKLPFRDDCLSHETYPAAVELPLGHDRHRSAPCSRRRGRPSAARSPWRWSATWLSRSIARAAAGAPRSSAREPGSTRPTPFALIAGSRRVPKSVHVIDEDSPLGPRTLADLGVPPYDIVRIDGTTGTGFFLLAADRSGSAPAVEPPFPTPLRSAAEPQPIGRSVCDVRHPAERRRPSVPLVARSGDLATTVIQNSRVRRCCCQHPLPSELYGHLSMHTAQASDNAPFGTRSPPLDLGDNLSVTATVPATELTSVAQAAPARAIATPPTVLLCLLRRLADGSRPPTPEGSRPAFAWSDLAIGSTPIHPIAGQHSLPPSSFTRSPIGVPRGRPTLTGGLRAYHVASQKPRVG